MKGVKVEDICVRGRWARLSSARRYIQTSRSLIFSVRLPVQVSSVGKMVFTWAKDDAGFFLENRVRGFQYGGVHKDELRFLYANLISMIFVTTTADLNPKWHFSSSGCVFLFDCDIRTLQVLSEKTFICDAISCFVMFMTMWCLCQCDVKLEKTLLICGGNFWDDYDCPTQVIVWICNNVWSEFLTIMVQKISLLWFGI